MEAFVHMDVDILQVSALYLLFLQKFLDPALHLSLASYLLGSVFYLLHVLHTSQGGARGAYVAL